VGVDVTKRHSVLSVARQAGRQCGAILPDCVRQQRPTIRKIVLHSEARQCGAILQDCVRQQQLTILRIVLHSPACGGADSQSGRIVLHSPAYGGADSQSSGLCCTC
jgi:hypothetical protein